MTDPAQFPQCRFYVRTQVSDDPLLYRYEPVIVRDYEGSGASHLRHPPAIGDLIGLAGNTKPTRGVFRVIDRSWFHADYGSASWPFGNAEPVDGPLLDLIVVPADGLFVNEAPSEEDE